jgi:polyferredoxin
VQPLNTFITQALSPALAISASGMLALSMNNRIGVLGSRVRELDRTIHTGQHSPERLRNLKLQVKYFVRRARLLRNGLLCLYMAVVMMVLTAFGLALSNLPVSMQYLTGSVSQYLPVATFLVGLLFILVGVVLEAVEVLLLLNALKLDVAHAFTSIDNVELK